MSFRTDLDPDKIPVTRPRLGVDGRTFFLLAFSFKCSHNASALIADILSEGELGSIADDFTVEMLKADGTEATFAADCVQTRVRYFPKWTYDLKAGHIHSHHSDPVPTGPVRVFAQLAPRIPAAYGGQKPYVCGPDFRFHTNFSFDGVTTTTIPFIDDSTPANEIEVLITHPAGFDRELMVVLELFK